MIIINYKMWEIIKVIIGKNKYTHVFFFFLIIFLLFLSYQNKEL